VHPHPPPEAEVARVMQICNACRYCEGFCAVFPAMTRRLEFGQGRHHYLANLCHNCGACLHACQYAPPHEFAVNVPQAMARVRGQTYADYAWPPALRRAVPTQRPDAGAGAGRRAGAVPGAGRGNERRPVAGAAPGGNFYSVFPHNLLVGLFAPVFGFAALALAMGVARFWRDMRPSPVARPPTGLLRRKRSDASVLRLKYLDGGHGDGLPQRRRPFTLCAPALSSPTFYGFILCFAATSVATLYHYAFGWVGALRAAEPAQTAGHVSAASACWSARQACGG
jgi:citrate/tricarballylate utilization protein